ASKGFGGCPARICPSTRCFHPGLLCLGTARERAERRGPKTDQRGPYGRDPRRKNASSCGRNRACSGRPQRRRELSAAAGRIEYGRFRTSTDDFRRVVPHQKRTGDAVTASGRAIVPEFARLLCIATLVSLAVLVTAATAQQFEPERVVSGVVVTEQNEVVPGAHILLRYLTGQEEAVTDAAG